VVVLILEDGARPAAFAASKTALLVGRETALPEGTRRPFSRVTRASK